MTNNTPLIQATQLSKRYGHFTAVDSLSFTCHAGEVIGFLGPNGAGKTTTMRMLTGYVPPSAGTAAIVGHDVQTAALSARQQLGYLPETVPLYPEMQVADYLTFIGRVRRIPDLANRTQAVLRDVDMVGRQKSYISTLSKGMRQRVGLAQALLHNPAVLILDEPTIGLDPRQVADVRQLIAALGEKHTILLSTHLLSEVEQICGRVLMLINGRLAADMPLSQATEERTLALHLATPTAETAAQLAQLAGVSKVDELGNGRYSLAYAGDPATAQLVGETAVQNQWGLQELTPKRVSLEAIFLQKLREAEGV
ncbi:MAG: ATP-binding cassette domain-containing protein [Chloroflexi bacterium]|nr:ATP-binding cassette domain-containing protein [Chloroflexota bacterium]